MRTPTLEQNSDSVHCRVQGSGHVVACVDSHRLIAGPLHGETVATIKPNQRWVRLNLQRYVGHRLHLEFTPDENSQLAVLLVVQGAEREALAEIEQWESSIEQQVQQYAQATHERLAEDQNLAREVEALVEDWFAERQDLKQQVQRTSHLAMAMMDGTGEDDRVLIRGNSSNPGPIVPRHFLTALTGDQPLPIDRGSGRLELAEQINAADNPLTSRVVVNRIWHHLLGRGIVPTTDDFGVLGQRPTHPRLLDHLATRFMRDGRSIKGLIRSIVLSRTYQMSSFADAGAVAVDPNNLLWHHRPPRRLEGEAIRDSILSASGQLDERMFGEPIPIHLTAFMEGRGRPGHSGPLDGAGRRSVYIAVRRNFISPFMLAFDTPVPFSTMGRRNDSNVPAQALILMNDPFVVQQMHHLAQQALAAVPGFGSTDESELAETSQAATLTEQRIRWMYATAFARQPTPSELQAATAFVHQQTSLRQQDLEQVELWADLAHALVNTKEFIFLR
jgi:hypothetical protein